MNESLVLHNNVAEIRKQQGMSQAELANLIGVSRNILLLIKLSKKTVNLYKNAIIYY